MRQSFQCRFLLEQGQIYPWKSHWEHPNWVKAWKITRGMHSSWTGEGFSKPISKIPANKWREKIRSSKSVPLVAVTSSACSRLSFDGNFNLRENYLFLIKLVDLTCFSILHSTMQTFGKKRGGKRFLFLTCQERGIQTLGANFANFIVNETFIFMFYLQLGLYDLKRKLCQKIWSVKTTTQLSNSLTSYFMELP